MRLPQPFFQLPLLLDAVRLQTEVAALPPEAWVSHPDRLPGNSAVPLIGPDGAATDDDGARAPMRATPWLAAMPYARQILAGLGVVWSRARLMRLAPGAVVPDHADINHHWHTRVRVHIPVVTGPQVRFFCGSAAVHMAAGEAWIFDNWRRHRVENGTGQDRVHLVADTTGTAAFWQLACGPALPRERWHRRAWQPAREAEPMTETAQDSPVMAPAEVELLLRDLCSELTPRTDTAELHARAARFTLLLENFVHDWRQLAALHGTGGERGRLQFRDLAAAVHAAAKPLSDGLVMRTNGVRALHVLEARVLKHLVVDDPCADDAAQARPDPAGSGAHRTATRQERRADRRLERPLFIVAAPRSGSTLLFETLVCSPAFNSFGGEAHWLVEDLTQLRPGAPGIHCNRLTAGHATANVSAAIRRTALARLQGADGAAPRADGRLLEKTPKNSLRVAFLKQVFPDARFILLWRDPRENLGSIMEAWRSGGWITYPSLPGWDGPWSLLLPPDYATLRGAPLASVAARQWRAANDTALDDLDLLPRADWTAVSYAGFLGNPATTVRRLCEFFALPFDASLRRRTAGPLPRSRSTHTPPAAEKWRRDQTDIERVMPSLQACWRRLAALTDTASAVP